MSGQSFEMTEHEFMVGDNNHEGRCTNCGVEADECEPDAREYKCEACGQMKVYGLAELLIMGLIDITPDEPEELDEVFGDDDE